MQIQKYTRWEYEFVEASYSDCYQMLLSGEIDMMCGLVKTPEREQEVIFSEYSATNTQNELYVRTDRELYYEEYEAFDGCRSAILKGTLRDVIDTYCEEHDFSLDFAEYDTQIEMEEALASGEVDMVFAASIGDEVVDAKVVARMEKVPIYYGVSHKSPELARELDDAMLKIVDNNPNFYTQLSEKYLVTGVNTTATFTREEIEYIQSKKTVYVILNTKWAPISWYDEDEKAFRGIVIDVLEHIARYSGLQFVYCSEDEFNALYAQDTSLENDVIAVLADDNAWAVTQNIMLTNHIADSSVVMVTKRSAHQRELDEDTVVALPRRFYISWCLQEVLEEEQIIYYETVQECLDAINSGKADMTYVNELVATYYLSMLEYSSLFATANSGYNENIAFAVFKDSNAPLLGILDKSLLCISADDLEGIIIRNAIADQKVSIRGLYFSSPVTFVSVIVTVVLILVVGVLAILNMFARKRRLDLELAREQENSSARMEFFMMISHELRTPLNAIVGYLNMALEEAKKKGWGQDYLRKSQNAAHQLTDISDAMLDYTRIASDTAQLAESVFNLGQLLRSVEQTYAPMAEKKGMAFSFQKHDFFCEYVIGDRLRLEQMMQNLLSNAVKFTLPGGSTETVVSQQESEYGVLEFVFSVKDTGRGMTEEFLQQVCQPFNQSDKAYSRTNGGLGLGLYLTKYYLEAMHGTMQVESTLGSGSCFTIRVPLRRADSEQILGAEISLSGVRVLIGGMHPESSDDLKALLKRLKVRSDIVTEPEKIMKRILSRLGGDYEYALCILDESVLECERELMAEVAALEKPPVIFVAADPEDALELAERSEIAQVLIKPVMQSAIFDAVLNQFGEYQAEESEELQADFGGMRAMIVEDNPVNADILQQLLAKMNIDVIICENGKIAVEAFEKQPENVCQIIFMDIQMPEMDGYETARQIRQSSAHGAGIPIVAVSANAFMEDVEKSLAAGMNEHLSKPISGSKLYKVIRKYCLEK